MMLFTNNFYKVPSKLLWKDFNAAKISVSDATQNVTRSTNARTKQPTLHLVGMKLLSMIIDRTQLLQDGHHNTPRAKNSLLTNTFLNKDSTTCHLPLMYTTELQPP